MSTLHSNKHIREACLAFFRATESARLSNTDVLPQDAGDGWWMQNGVMFRASPEVTESLNRLVPLVLKAMGTEKTNESHVRGIAKDIASAPGDAAQKTKRLLSKIEEDSTTTNERVEPCFAVVLQNVAELKIGRVRIRQSNYVAKEFNKNDPRWQISPNQPCALDIGPDGIILGLPKNSWHVLVNCAKGNVKQEASWLIDVALSLLRLSIPPKKRGAHFPQIGSLESSPISPPQQKDISMTLSKSGVTFGGSVLRDWYEVSPRTFSKGERKKLSDVGDIVGSPVANTISERFSRGLGWMTRARRAEDLATRFLYFFTAIECLLTRDDKNAPVVDTICRSAACILANKLSNRAILAKEFEDLYALRSKLVHAGDRGVSHSDSRRLQIRAEILFVVVLEKVDLRTPLNDFHKQLKLSGYGTPWP